MGRTACSYRSSSRPRPTRLPRQALKALEAAGHPVIRIILRDVLDLGAEFFRWEVATAAAASLMGIDPFDQPNVQESKENTRDLLAEYRAQGKFSDGDPLFESDGLTVYGDGATQSAAGTSVGGALAAFLTQARPGDYVALMAYIHRRRSTPWRSNPFGNI